MASSSIEVMGGGGGETKVMVLEGPVEGRGMEEMHTIIATDGGHGQLVTALETPASTSQEEDFPDVGSEFQTLEGMEPPPGTIIFSPQDLMRPSKPVRGRGRGRSVLASVKQEPGVPTLGGSQSLEMPVACDICGKVMMTGKILVQHMAIHSDLKPFQCPHCPKSFARKVHLQGHLVVHGIEKQFECPVCHQRFSRQDCVKVHMRLHDKSKCVYCDVCHKAFLTVGALNIHLRIHRGEKPFKCHLCGKCFTQKNHLITHIKRHTKVTDEHFTKKLGPRMFKCEHCPRSFIRLSDYERHVQWNHGAIAEGSVVDKLPTVGNLLDGEMKQTGLAPQIFKVPRDALNSKPRTRRPRKVMCSASTQTDDEGGHIIIPRQYQVSAATQVSAPPTPRPADEDMYENDIFDEGMDRNYSSDEDEEGVMEGADNKKEYQMPQSSEMASDPLQDAAFDAIVQGNTKPPEPRAASTSTGTQDEHAALLQEVVSTLNKQEAPKAQVSTGEQITESIERDTSKDYAEDNIPQQRIINVGELDNVTITEALPEKEIEPEPMQREEFDGDGSQDGTGLFLMPTPTPTGRRPRGRKRSVFGLTGAAELRAIRRNMLNLLSAPKEEPKIQEQPPPQQQQEDEEEEEEEEEEEGQEEEKITSTATEEGGSEGRSRRMAKKQHGKDFVCNMKNCDTCNGAAEKPQPKAQPKFKVKIKTEKPSPEKIDVSRKVIPINKESIKQQIIREINKRPIEMDKMAETKKMKFEEPKMKVDNRVGTYPVDITANPLTNKANPRKEDYFVATSNADSIISPPVELMSFCIPTYSCKLCGREFRFEGKLHRHIESVHQNKSIFSPDVKPGRGSTKVMAIMGGGGMMHQEMQQMVVPKTPAEPENPEIAALRSEWDDDDEDEEEVDTPVPAPTSITQTFTTHAPITIITRDIAPVTTTLTDTYSSGVKVNMNKLAGLLPPGKTTPVVPGTSMNVTTTVTSVTHSRPREPETIMADTLDMKCRRLLEKLFDHDLLMNCGLTEEHVSVVLGRVLQHYGVKMIEDYGQGQYEVLKYNLWRLIEWKVTMEQMEEFYTAGKSVEEMMDDIMNERVPLVSHHFVPQEQSANNQVQPNQGPQVTQVEAVDVGDGQMVLQQVAGVLGGQLNLPEGVTQVVLAPDVTPDLLQGAHIVTIDPTTGQVISQVTADQVILTDAIGDELEQQVAALDGQVVVSQAASGVQSVSQGSIVVNTSSMPVQVQSRPQISSHGQVIVQTTAPQPGPGTSGHSSHQQ